MTDYFGAEWTEKELHRCDVIAVDLLAHYPAATTMTVTSAGVGRLAAPIAAVAGGRMIEIGCHAGFLAERLMQSCETYCGVDVSPVMVQLCRGRFREWSHVHFAHSIADAQRLQDTEGSWDVAFGHDFFIHLRRPERAQVFAGLRRLLAPGGRLVVDYWPAEESDEEPPARVIGWMAYKARPEDIAAQIEAAGFRVLGDAETVPGVRHYVTAEKVG